MSRTLKHCVAHGCARRVRYASGYCISHHSRFLTDTLDKPITSRVKQGATCKYCNSKPHSLGLCHVHRERLKRGANMTAPVLKRAKRIEQLRNTLPVRVPNWIMERIRNRAAIHSLSNSALIRAILEQWAHTQGAPTGKEHFKYLDRKDSVFNVW